MQATSTLSAGSSRLTDRTEGGLRAKKHRSKTPLSTVSKAQMKGVFTAIAVLFLIFALFPMIAIVVKSLVVGGHLSFSAYREMFTSAEVLKGMRNSFGVAGLSALIATGLAFVLAYTIHFTAAPKGLKRFISVIALLPMLMPTITYGFALIYSFGKQGLLTRLFHHQFFSIYGTRGLVIGFVIYTMPIAFMLIESTMHFIDKKYLIVSEIMGDNAGRRFLNTVLIPMLGTLATAFIQSFTLSFTDYGIPMSIAGNMDLAATLLYGRMLGTFPDFAAGAVIAIMMLIPAVINVSLIQYLKRFNIRYSATSDVDMRPSAGRDVGFSAASLAILIAVVMMFAVIFVVPFVDQWPYSVHFSLKHFAAVFSDSELSSVVKHSLFVSLLTALIGTLVVYGAALFSGRTSGTKLEGQTMDAAALTLNTVPGMVIGVAYMLAFKGTALQNTFAILIICNIVHLFPSPYLMMKNALEKLNPKWEQTAALMGDSWFKTVGRILTPNVLPALLETFSFYFINAMVTVSAVIFVAGAHTMVMTVKIQQLQHFADFDDIFVLSVLIFVFNLVAKGAIERLKHVTAHRRLSIKS
ncbi:MAG: iron ABC transporter permease [Pseudoramibacter sp.]|jgi:iron(III) transport system permease protein